MPMDTTAIARAVAIIGSQTELAEILGVTPGLVWQWINGRRVVDSKHCLAIERAVDKISAGAVTRYDLRPDVFGEKPAAESKAVA